MFCLLNGGKIRHLDCPLLFVACLIACHHCCTTIAVKAPLPPPSAQQRSTSCAVDNDGRLCLAPTVIIKQIDRQCNDCCCSIHATCRRPLPHWSLSTTMMTTLVSLQTPTTLSSVNVIHLPSSRQCLSISMRSYGMAPCRCNEVKAYQGRCHCQHLR